MNVETILAQVDFAQQNGAGQFLYVQGVWGKEKERMGRTTRTRPKGDIFF
jgi:hypothetical protein